MLTTILTILKIIGIVLLIILGVILGLLILVLFWPYKYKISGDNREKLNGYVVLSWFFHLIHIKAYYLDDFNIEARVLGIKIYDKRKKDEAANKADYSDKSDKKTKKKTADDKKTDKKSNDSTEDLKSNDNTDVYESNDIESNDYDKNRASSDNAEDDIIYIDDDNEDDFDKYFDDESDKKASKKSDNKKGRKLFGTRKTISFTDWLWGIFDKVWDFIDDFPYKIIEFAEKPEKKINDIVDVIYYYDRILSSKGTEWVIAYIKKKVIALLRALKPSRCDINIDYAATDPEKAAKAYEVYCMTIPYQPRHTKMNVYFDHDEFKFDARIKGDFILGIVLYHAATLVFNKKVKKFIKLMKREGK